MVQVGAINDRIDGRTEGGKGKETKDGKEASFADLKRRKWQMAVEKYLLGMDAVRFLQGRQAVWDIFPIFSFGLLPPLFQNLSIRSLAKPLYSIITHHAPANPVSEAFLGESLHSANLKGQCLFKDQISIRPTNKKKEQQLRFSRKHDVGA